MMRAYGLLQSTLPKVGGMQDELASKKVCRVSG